jgi:hypothetical protein
MPNGQVKEHSRSKPLWVVETNTGPAMALCFWESAFAVVPGVSGVQRCGMQRRQSSKMPGYRPPVPDAVVP